MQKPPLGIIASERTPSNHQHTHAPLHAERHPSLIQLPPATACSRALSAAGHSQQMAHTRSSLTLLLLLAVVHLGQTAAACTTSSFCTSRSAGLYANPCDATCNSFLQCSNGQTYVMSCSPTLVFNPTISNCDYTSSYKCPSTTSQPTPAPTTAPTKPTPTPSKPTPTPTPTPSQAPTSSGATAYVTYHSYDSSTSLYTVACSDGANGLITRWGYSSVSPLYPGVTAASFISWNSPSCGACIQLFNAATGATVYATVVDGCGGISGYSTHFDLDPDTFTALLGSAGIAAGHGVVKWSTVSSSMCRGNKGPGAGK